MRQLRSHILCCTTDEKGSTAGTTSRPGQRSSPSCLHPWNQQNVSGPLPSHVETLRTRNHWAILSHRKFEIACLLNPTNDWNKKETNEFSQHQQADNIVYLENDSRSKGVTSAQSEVFEGKVWYLEIPYSARKWRHFFSQRSTILRTSCITFNSFENSSKTAAQTYTWNTANERSGRRGSHISHRYDLSKDWLKLQRKTLRMWFHRRGSLISRQTDTQIGKRVSTYRRHTCPTIWGYTVTKIDSHNVKYTHS